MVYYDDTPLPAAWYSLTTYSTAVCALSTRTRSEYIQYCCTRCRTSYRALGTALRAIALRKQPVLRARTAVPGTPLEDAYRHNNKTVIKVLEANGGLRKDDPSQEGLLEKQKQKLKAQHKADRQPVIQKVSAGPQRVSAEERVNSEGSKGKRVRAQRGNGGLGSAVVAMACAVLAWRMGRPAYAHVQY
eukprot:3320873-Rhodomonas_salina.3